MLTKYSFTLFLVLFPLWLAGMEHNTVKIVCSDSDIEIPIVVAQQFEVICNLQEDMSEETKFPLPGISKSHVEQIVACMPHGEIDKKYCLMMSLKKLCELDEAMHYLGVPLELERLKLEVLERGIRQKGYLTYLLRHGMNNAQTVPLEHCTSTTQQYINERLKESMMSFVFPCERVKVLEEATRSSSLAFGGGKVFAAFSYGIKEWEKSSGIYKGMVEDKNNGIIAANNTLLAYDWGNTLKVVNVETRNLSCSLPTSGYLDRIMSLTFNDKFLFSGNKVVHGWDVQQEEPTHVLSLGRREIGGDHDYSQALAGHTDLLGAAYQNRGVLLFDIRAKDHVTEFPSKNSQHVAIDNTVVIAACVLQQSIDIYDLRNFKKLNALSAYAKAGLGLEHDVVFYEDQKGYITLQNLRTGQSKKLLNPCPPTRRLSPQRCDFFAVNDNTLFCKHWSGEIIRVHPEGNKSLKEALDALPLKKTLLLNALACEKNKENKDFSLSKPAKELYESIDPNLRKRFIESK